LPGRVNVLLDRLDEMLERDGFELNRWGDLHNRMESI
jgi:hypothetical protein